MIAAVIIPDTATVLEAALQARAAGLHLITDGRRTVLSPVIPPGWFRCAVKIKPSVRDAYELTDATAGCCDIGRAA